LTQKQRIHNIRGGTLSTAHYWYIFKCPLTSLFGQDVFVMAYANNVMGYIPSTRVLRECGYEGGELQIVYG